MDRVEVLLGPRPFTDPPPWPEIPREDAEVAELLASMRDGIYLRAAAKAVGERGSAEREQLLLDMLEALVDGWQDAFYTEEQRKPHAASPEVHAEYHRWYADKTRRGAQIELLLTALGRRPSDAAMERIDALRRRCPAHTVFEALGNFLIGQRQNDLFESELAAPPSVLGRLAEQIAIGDRGFRHALCATYVLQGPDGLGAVVDQLLREATEEQRFAIASAVKSVGLPRLFAADPAWVDRVSPLLLDRGGLSWHLDQLGRLDLLLRALRFPMCASELDRIAGRIRRHDDVSAVPAIQEVAAALGDAPTEGDARTRSALLRVVRYLTRDRSKALPKAPSRREGMGTDGGPILLLDAAAAVVWKGAPKDYGEPGCDPNNDYDRACDAPEDNHIGVIDVGGSPALVLPAQLCELATVQKMVWIIIAGEDDDIVWNALGPEALPFEPTATELEVAGGLLLLDAAYTTRDRDRKKAVKLAPGTYHVEELFVDDDRGWVHLVRLRPDGVDPKKAPKVTKKAPKVTKKAPKTARKKGTEPSTR
jgi:hypothetical protein